jgi:hypothetical protein
LALEHPAQLTYVEVAREEQVAASVWSKMFPGALLVIMALTGAFYPAIDLGAGEKERGTMETLLISPAKRVELVLGKFADDHAVQYGDSVAESDKYGTDRTADGVRESEWQWQIE